MEGRRHHVAVGNLESAWGREELFADREGRLLGMGTVSAGFPLALRTVALLVQALLVPRRYFDNLRGRRFPRRPRPFRAA